VNEKLISIYLRDHLAGARAGIELARRVRGSNDGTAYAGELAGICTEIEQDRDTLIEIADRLGVGRDPVKESSAWVAEKMGRLKLNGRLTGYSPLSRLLELEGLIMGVTGKLELWRSLRAAGDERLADLDLKKLIGRAEHQRRRLDELHDRAAAEALTG